MKTLVIHPSDRSTDFLVPIYENMPQKKVLRKKISEKQLVKEIVEHDQIIMLGHGTPSGLMNVANIGDSFFSIGARHADLLRKKRCIFIWCNADQFVKANSLKGLYTGMFISEVQEAEYCKVKASLEEISSSNDLFAEALGKSLLESKMDFRKTWSSVEGIYGKMALENLVAKYNHERWYVID